MTEHTVEIQTTETRTVETCDECGLGADHGELIEFRAQDWDEPAYGSIHYHRECLDGLGITRPAALADVERQAVEENSSVVLALGLGELVVAVISSVALLGSAAAFGASGASGGLAYGAVGVVGLVGLVYSLRAGIRRGSLLG